MDSGPGVRFAIRLDAELRIADIRFETTAFDAARPAASALCRALLGATVAQASGTTVIDVALMAGLEPKSAVARTVHFAKSAALLPLLGRVGPYGPPVTCTCFHVTTARIRDAIARHRMRTVEDVRRRTQASSGCGTCRPDVQRLLDEEAAGRG